MTKGKWLRNGKCGAPEWRTADPSATPDFLSRVAASVGCVWFSLKRTTSGVAGESSAAGNPGSLGMTERRGGLKGRGLLPREKAFVGAAGTPSIDTSPFRAKAKKSQALGMTRKGQRFDSEWLP